MRQYEATQIYQDYLTFLEFLYKTKSDLERPRDVAHGLDVMQLFYVWILLFESQQYPLLLEKLFVRTISRERKAIGFAHADEVERICKQLRFFLFTQKAFMAKVIEDTLRLRLQLQQDQNIGVSVRNDTMELFRTYQSSAETDFLEDIRNDVDLDPILKGQLEILIGSINKTEDSPTDYSNRGLIIDENASAVTEYAEHVKHTKEKIIPKVVTFLAQLAEYFNRYTICEGDCIEIFNNQESKTIHFSPQGNEGLLN